MSKQELSTLIEQKRNELIQVAMKTGFTSSISIKYSQELDKLLNEYHNFFKEKQVTMH